MPSELLAYIQAHPFTLGVAGVLILYFFLINVVFFYRYLQLGRRIRHESKAFELILLGNPTIPEASYLSPFIPAGTKLSKALFDLIVFSATKESTKGLVLLSISASTAPFIGLFGTVISILVTFHALGQSNSTIGRIATGVSEALVATAMGIFVAIFAYTYHQLLKRRAYEYTSLVQMEGDALLSRGG